MTKKRKLDEERKTLPIHAAKERLLEELTQHETVIIVGETGSGKTTQIPQFVHDAGLANGLMVACTQPRRVAAISVVGLYKLSSMTQSLKAAPEPLNLKCDLLVSELAFKIQLVPLHRGAPRGGGDRQRAGRPRGWGVYKSNPVQLTHSLKPPGSSP